MKAIKYMLGLDDYDFLHLLDHPLWQMQVRQWLSRAKWAIITRAQHTYYAIKAAKYSR